MALDHHNMNANFVKALSTGNYVNEAEYLY